MKGAVIKFDDKKGYGFIQPDGKDGRVFVHATDVTTAGRLTAGQRVTFDVTQSAKGLRATNVAVEGAAARSTQRSGSTPISPYLIFGTLAVIATILVMGLGMVLLLLAWLWAYLIAINLTTLILYVYDWAVAGRGMVRVPERILHAAELFGGTPAAFISQRRLHHKSAKGSYQRVFRLIFIVQALIVVGMVYLGLV